MNTQTSTPRDTLIALIRGARMTREQAAEAACVSIHTLHAYLKPETSVSSIEPPRSVLELLALKTGQSGLVDGLDAEISANRAAAAHAPA